MTENSDMDAINNASKATRDGKQFDVFICETCDPEGKVEYSRVQVGSHLLDVHGIDIKIVKCRRDMLMHLDGRDWYQSNYRYDFGSGVTLINYTRNKRGKGEGW